jgi:hypothetical protein
VAESRRIRAAKAQVEILGAASNACESFSFHVGPPLILLSALVSPQDKIASFLGLKPNLSYRIVQTDSRGLVSGIREFSQSGIRINAGFFVLKRDILKYLQLVLGSVIRGPQCHSVGTASR